LEGLTDRGKSPALAAEGVNTRAEGREVVSELVQELLFGEGKMLY
jgi:hypothetical protein